MSNEYQLRKDIDTLYNLIYDVDSSQMKLVLKSEYIDDRTTFDTYINTIFTELNSKSDNGHGHNDTDITLTGTFAQETGITKLNNAFDIVALSSEYRTNKVSAWSDTPTNTNYPSEKLVKDSLDNKEPLHTDSGWQSPTYETGFSDYGSTNKLLYRKVGNVVMIQGYFKNTATISSTSAPTIFATIPSAYRPSVDVITVQPTGGIQKYNFYVDSGGELALSHYGTTSADSVPSNTVFMANVTYMI